MSYPSTGFRKEQSTLLLDDPRYFGTHGEHNMEYAPQKLVQKQLPKPGTLGKATVVAIRLDEVQHLMQPEQLNKFILAAKNVAKDTPFLEVKFRLEDGAVESQMFSYPENGKDVSPRSELGKYAIQYGHYPEEEDAITIVADTKGYWKIFVGK